MKVSDIKYEVREVFDPLADRFGLDGPIELCPTRSNFHLGYVGQTIGLEIDVETMDFFIYALLFRPKGDIVPLGYDDENGKRQKLYVQQALKDLGIDISRETQDIQKLGGNFRNCREMAEKLARLIEANWPLLSSNAERWFA